MDDDGDQDSVIEEDFYTFLNVPKNVRECFTFYLIYVDRLETRINLVATRPT